MCVADAAGAAGRHRKDPETLSMTGRRHLGEALRALLVLEVRQARLAGRQACERTPAHLPPGCAALRCALRSASGAAASVVLGGPLPGAGSGVR